MIIFSCLIFFKKKLGTQHYPTLLLVLGTQHQKLDMTVFLWGRPENRVVWNLRQLYRGWEGVERRCHPEGGQAWRIRRSHRVPLQKGFPLPSHHVAQLQHQVE